MTPPHDAARSARAAAGAPGLEVWAPHAHRVDVEVAGERHELVPGERHGWWTYAGDVPPGTDYGFVLDGGDDVLPDPRSPWQPHGVHGRSRTVDHAAFAWTDRDWRAPALRDCVVYELHVGTFTPEGTFDAAVERLPHVRDLGVNAVELLPVNQFPGEHGWGYDGVDLYAVHHAYGGPDGLKRFVDAAHGLGLAVVMDVVYNHLGPAGNYLGRFGPYFTDRYRTPWGPAVNYDDAGSDEVRAFVVGNALMWMRDYHCDGLRLDAVHAIYDQSATHLLEEVSAAVAPYGFVVAESDLNDPRVVTPRERGGLGCDAQWSDDFHHALHAALTGEDGGYYADFGRLGDVAKALECAYVYDGLHSRYRGRRHGRKLPEGLPATAFLGYLQDHDQIGNRATGERSSHLLSPGLLKVAAALVLTAPFVPMLFMGEEWGATTPWQYFTSHEDEALAEAVRKGRREEFAAFGWSPEDVPDPQDPATFERSKLDWSEVDAHADLLDWHRRLVALRHAEPALRDGSFAEAVSDELARTLVVRRGPFVVAANLSREPRPYASAAAVVLASETYDGETLAPESVVVLRP